MIAARCWSRCCHASEHGRWRSRREVIRHTKRRSKQQHECTAVRVTKLEGTTQGHASILEGELATIRQWQFTIEEKGRSRKSRLRATLASRASRPAQRPNATGGARPTRD